MENYLKDKVGEWKQFENFVKEEVLSCEHCDSTKDKLTRHHLLPKSARRLKEVQHMIMDSNYNPNYTMLLCEKCHVKLHQMKSNKELALNFNTPKKVLELLQKYQHSTSHQRLNGLCYNYEFVNVFESTNMWN